MNEIRFEHVWKLFEGNAVVSDLNLDIREGEFLVLVGPSGCGKTTSLRMLAGLERPSHGRIYMGDRDVTDPRPESATCPWSFRVTRSTRTCRLQEPGLWAARFATSPRLVWTRVSMRWPICSAFDTCCRASPSALSGGQRQRVALGRALIREPHVFLMDEPLSNLDAALRVQMRAEFIRLHKRLESTTTVYVTHDQVEALTMGDRVAVLKDGVLLQVDSANDLYEYPESVFVGEFIGSPKMNVLPGVARHLGGRDHASRCWA